MDDKFKQNLSDMHTWLRLIYMIGFGVILYLCLMLFWLSPLVQFLFVLISAKRSERVARWVDMLNQYIAQVMAFLSFDSEQKPFPFYDFPSSEIVLDDAPSDTEATQDSHVTKQTEAVSENSVVSEQFAQAESIANDRVEDDDQVDSSVNSDEGTAKPAQADEVASSEGQQVDGGIESEPVENASDEANVKADKGAIA